MSLLTRYLQLNDAHDSQIFTFVVTKAVTRDFHREVISKNFTYAWHKWAVTFTREDKNLGVLLVWRSPSRGIKVQLDVSITLLNRENFSENRSFKILGAKFESGNENVGHKNLIKLAELLTHRPRFVDANGEFLIEVRLSNASTYFECDLYMHPDQIDDSQDFEAAEVTSNEFVYGVFCWFVCAKPQPLILLPLSTNSSWSGPVRKALQQQQTNNSSNNHGMTNGETYREFDNMGVGISIRRLSNHNTDDLYAKLNYQVVVVKGDDVSKTSEVVDEVLGPGFNSMSWSPRCRLHELYKKPEVYHKIVHIRILLFSAHPVTEVVLNPCGAAGSNGAGFKNEAEQVETKGFAHVVNGARRGFYRDSSGGSGNGPSLSTDAENVNWAVDLDLHSSFIRVKLMLQDIERIPRNHLRFVQWRAFMVRRSRRWRGHRDDRGQLESVELQPGTSYKFYYSQDEADQGVIMETNLPTKDVRDGVSEYVEDGLYLRVRIQWEHSFQLFQSTYSQYDEVVKIHNQQMRDEIEDLKSRLESSFLQKDLPPFDSKLEMSQAAESCLNVVPVCRSPSPIPNYITNEGEESSRAPSPMSPRVKRILIKSNSHITPGTKSKNALRVVPPLQHQRSLQSTLAPPSWSQSVSPSLEKVNGRAASLNRLTRSNQSLRKTDSNSSAGSTSTPPPTAETSASGPGSPTTWSPTIPLIKLIAPLRQTFSFSADALPRPRQMAAEMRKQWPKDYAKSSQVSKCQSVD